MITTETVDLGEGFQGLLAYPARAPQPLPCVIVIQEAFGVDAHIADVAGRIARSGYAAIAPDLFGRHGTRKPELTIERLAEVKAAFDVIPLAKLLDPATRAEALAALPPEQAARVGASQAAMFAAIGDAEHNLAGVRAAARYAREVCPVTRGAKLASMGFCMGGGLSARLAAHEPALAGAIVFYGMAPADAEARQIRCPVLGLYGANDPRINGSVPGFQAALGDRLEAHTYEGAGHAFFNDTRASYHLGAARDAWVRTVAFLARVLT